MKGLKKARMTSKKTSNYKSRPKRLTRRLIGGKDPSIVPQPPRNELTMGRCSSLR